MNDKKRPTSTSAVDAVCSISAAERPGTCTAGIKCDGCAQSPKWRTDFPIEWEGDHYVSRREMVKFLTLGSTLLAVASWITVGASRILHRGAKVERYIRSAAALDREGYLLFRYPTDEDPCIAVKTPEGKLVAYSQVCTHLSCAVIYNEKENNLLCPCHNGMFSIDEGVPIAGPPTRPLPRVKIEQRGERLFAVEFQLQRARSERAGDRMEA